MAFLRSSLARRLRGGVGSVSAEVQIGGLDPSHLYSCERSWLAPLSSHWPRSARGFLLRAGLGVQPPTRPFLRSPGVSSKDQPFLQGICNSHSKTRSRWVPLPGHAPLRTAFPWDGRTHAFCRAGCALLRARRSCCSGGKGGQGLQPRTVGKWLLVARVNAAFFRKPPVFF